MALHTTVTTLVQAGPWCRPTTLRMQWGEIWLVQAGSVRIDWIVNGGYEGTIITDQFPTSKVCSRDKFICVVADFKSTFGYPRLTLNYRSKTYVYPEIHVWNSNEYMNHEIEYWDCI
ncbi:hypothetical protein BGZ59_009344 [Podila verticillata]|nr:hypothetical protein BGZ59_009344 [Podila verticillata]KFH63634.1 hypothetical protein MVEG_10328 [Podila verticillata NRRL 6337]